MTRTPRLPVLWWVWPVAIAGLLASMLDVHVGAAELTPQLSAAFARYVSLTESRIRAEVASAGTFLWVDTLREDRRRAAQRRLAKGEPVVESLETTDGSKSIRMPGGMVEHAVGTIFVPGASLDATVALFQDYSRYPAIFKDIRRASATERDGDAFRSSMRVVRKQFITVTLNVDRTTRFSHLDTAHVSSTAYSTRIVEVVGAGTADEHERTGGVDHGFLWHLNVYGRYVERDGGTYVQLETVSLSRSLPTGFGFLSPWVRRMVEDEIADGLRAMRQLLAR